MKLFRQGTVKVATRDALLRALREAKPGTRIEIAPGEYPGGLFVEGIRGAAGRPIVIVASDPARPPRLRGGGNGLHLAGAAYVEIDSLDIAGASDNGLNIDDGGSRGNGSAPGIVLRRVTVAEIGPVGNHDGIKLSGLDDFRIENCRVERWGVGQGNAIDMVGCHRGVIEGCTFRHRPGADTGGGGVQMKGGCRTITVRKCRFENTGNRGVNLGGSTGFPYFRPPLDRWPDGPTKYEAKDLRVEGCTFIGGVSAVSFTGVDGAIVRGNTIYVPERWVFRILQETTAPGFVPSRNGVFEKNLVAFQSDKWFEGGVNIGPRTAPETFRFAENWWYCVDAPARSRPKLPTPEQNGTYGRDPLFRDAANGDLRLRGDSPALGKAGAETLR